MLCQLCESFARPAKPVRIETRYRGRRATTAAGRAPRLVVEAVLCARCYHETIGRAIGAGVERLIDQEPPTCAAERV